MLSGVVGNLPQFMHNVPNVIIQDPRHSHWVIEAPAGKTVEWDSEITQDEPGRLIAWQSLEGSSVRNSGQDIQGAAERGDESRPQAARSNTSVIIRHATGYCRTVLSIALKATINNLLRNSTQNV
jgi:uncharacterized membrane protein